MKNIKFYKVKEKYLKTLIQYVPVVNRVHGNSHPEFREVKSSFDQIVLKIKDVNNDLNLETDFENLRKITNNYKVPNDVCESYEAVYMMLEQLDAAYHLKGE